MKKIGRPKKENPKEQLNITIKKELNEILGDFVDKNNLSKSEYIEHLIKTDMGNKVDEQLQNIRNEWDRKID